MRVTGLKKAYGERIVFDGEEFTFPEGRITCVMGKSGAGKTTLLKILAGLTPFEGGIEGGGKSAFVFQEPRLISHMTVAENIAFAVGRYAVNEEKLAGMLTAVGLGGMQNRRAGELSVGEAQRVALVRAFACEAPVVLLDEPFSALDKESKELAIDAFLALWREKRQTVVLVTHEEEEALRLGESVIRLPVSK